ncbi:MAG TPA: bifunctional oligoribonuclease/PAP phosphatase NrnA [Anaerolineae bacterium]|nr:bifunctional oligoribonuclease/PAP phosphatase NrnA [Anaerolineae bacterium]
MREKIKEVRALLDRAKTVTIIAHVRPDGDAVGSLLALTLSLEANGKHVVPVLADGVPARFLFLPGADQVQKNIPSETDLLITLDCADLERAGLSEEHPRQVDINIDHHPTNSRFAKFNLVDPSASATTQILYDLSEPLSLPISPDVATNLITGLLTDTLGFRTENVTSRVLRVAADLMDIGADLHDAYHRGLVDRSYLEARYWGQGLSKLQLDDGVLFTSLTLEDGRSIGYGGRGDADLIDLLSTITGVQVAIIFVEQPRGKVKVSWRSRKGTDVSRLAEKFGGGGHEPAAGAMVEGDLEEVQDRVLSATHELLETIPTMEMK